MKPEQLMQSLKHLNLTQNQFADRIGVTKNTIINWKRDNSVPLWVSLVISSLKRETDSIEDYFLDQKKSLKIGEIDKNAVKISGGLCYATATSDKIAEYENTIYFGSDQYISETLYQTQSGAFFMVVQGNKHSAWGCRDIGSNEYSDGHTVFDISETLVKKWLEMRELYEDYIDIFGQPPSA